MPDRHYLHKKGNCRMAVPMVRCGERKLAAAATATTVIKGTSVVSAAAE